MTEEEELFSYTDTTVMYSTTAAATTGAAAEASSEFTVWQSALLGILLSCIILISVGGNILVCIAILTDRLVCVLGMAAFIVRQVLV